MKMMSNPRIRRYVARASVFLITATLIVGMVGCDGDGSQNLEIRTWYDLDAVRDNLAGNYTLMNDLDSSTLGYEELASPTANGGQGWQPIGPENHPFDGTFEGQGYEIRDLYINRHDGEAVGVFGGVGYDGVIKDVGVIVNITSIHTYGGGLTAVNLGTVSNSYSTGHVTGNQFVGGLVGYNDGTVSDSYFTGSVNGVVAVGGLVGYSLGTVSNSYSTGNVTGNESVGGLVGFNDGTVSDSYSTGSVTGDTDVGGLVGLSVGTVSNSYYNCDEALINGQSIITVGALLDEDFDEWLTNDKFLDVNDRLSQEDGYYLINDISDFKELLAFGQDGSLKFRLTDDLDLATEPDFYIPYMAGEFDGDGHKISNLSFNFDFVSRVGLFGRLASGGNVAETGVENVSITADDSAGGLVGDNGGTVSNSYATGSVSGTYWVGGLVGDNSGTVTNSHFTGSVTGDRMVGGLVGFSGGTVGNSYSSGNVTGSICVGGLVGWEGGHVGNSYSTGSVTGNSSVGGLVGGNEGGTVSNSYSTGSVTGNSSVGGLVGRNDGDVSNSFWDAETSGLNFSAGGTGKNTTEMLDILTFSGAGWNITAVALNETNPAYIWNIVNNVTYPFLGWQV